MYKPEVALKVVDQFIEELVQFLIDSGVEIKSQKLADIKTQLQEIVILNPKKDYISIVTDKNGYIKGYNIMDTIVENVDLPEDLGKGYYKLNKNNKPVLDKKRRRDLWGD
jgi:hypothetical protein